MTRASAAARLEWANARQDWTIKEWESIVFSDEARFELYGSDGRVRVRRSPGEEMLQHNFAKCVQKGVV